MAMGMGNDLQQMTHYSVAMVYKKMEQRHGKVCWSGYVWNRFNLPKHRVIIWMVMRMRLQTCARLWRKGLYSSDACVLCKSDSETHEHLFFWVPSQ